jgi:hypothetical protein
MVPYRQVEGSIVSWKIVALELTSQTRHPALPFGMSALPKYKMRLTTQNNQLRAFVDLGTNL